MEQLIFRGIIYSAIGIFIEVCVTALSKWITIFINICIILWKEKSFKNFISIFKKYLTIENEKLTGYSYVWMIFLYFPLLLFIFEPVHNLIINFDWYFRWIIWGISFTFFEYLYGFFYTKLLGFCPWSYDFGIPLPKDKGWTAVYTIPLWSVAAWFLTWYSPIIRGLFK